MLFRLIAFCLLASLFVTANAADEKKKADTKPDTQKMFDKLDSDGDGKVTLEEFAFLPNTMKDAKRASNAELAATFAKLDTSKDKKLTADEFKKISDIGLVKADPKKKK